MIGVEKNPVADSVLYKDASVQHQLYKTDEVARAAHQLAALNTKFLAKFHYGTDACDRIVDMELDKDLLENLYDALIDGHEKLVQEKQKREEEVRRKFNESQVNQITRVKYDKPWTIVWWNDGQVTRSKCAENDVWSEAAGFNACVAKRYFQTVGAYNKVMKTYCKNEDHNPGYGDYERGYKMGYEDGIDIGTMRAEDAKRQTKDEAYADGRNLGYDEGYDDGYAAAEDEAYNKGFDEGQKYERQLQKETNFEN